MQVRDLQIVSLHKYENKKILLLSESPLKSEDLLPYFFFNQRDECDTVIDYIAYIIKIWKKVEILVNFPHEPQKWLIYQYLEQNLFKKTKYNHGMASIYKNMKSCPPTNKKSILFKKCPFDPEKVGVQFIDILRVYDKDDDFIRNYFYKMRQIDNYFYGFKLPLNVEKIKEYTKFILKNNDNLLVRLLNGLGIQTEIQKMPKVYLWLQNKYNKLIRDLNTEYENFKNISKELPKIKKEDRSIDLVIANLSRELKRIQNGKGEFYEYLGKIPEKSREKLKRTLEELLKNLSEQINKRQLNLESEQERKKLRGLIQDFSEQMRDKQGIYINSYKETVLNFSTKLETEIEVREKIKKKIEILNENSIVCINIQKQILLDLSMILNVVYTIVKVFGRDKTDNFIIFTNDKMDQFYKELLGRLGAEQIAHVNKSNKCIDVSDIDSKLKKMKLDQLFTRLENIVN